MSWLVLLLLTASKVLATPTTLQPRSDCKILTVASGDSCASLATKCGISAQDLAKYNTDPKFCSTLAPGARICCSSGSLPDVSPKIGSDGVCATYTVKAGDICSSIVAANGLQLADLTTFNDGSTGTWGWSGCDTLTKGQNICLSKGDQPMPAPDDNAICGPTVKGTSWNSSKPLFELNPCPLNACCNVWGQCGITPEFCTYKQAKTGNPGTSPPGINACVSGCDSDKPISKADGPASFINVGYYESWNYQRPCLNMRVASIDTTEYTHVHWAFGLVSTNDFSVHINDTDGQWPAFKNLTGAKKIISIGGWGFSTDPSTYAILRNAMSPSNIDAFATQVTNFVNSEGLDGIDIDWEYPGATDIPSVAPGSSPDPSNYLAFLKTLRGKLGKDKSISIAAPASYWYLKAFPISEMAQVVDYIIYMTYDLHGQWDYGSKYSQDGCSNGDCLRSHANLTETIYALTMITKAGVATNKIVVGMPSYGRSFAMAQTGCTGPECKYQGPDSQAIPGDCTETAGILANAEINEILITARVLEDNSTRTWYDTDSNTNILVYNDTQWVAYVDETTRASRRDYYKSMNFLGTVDWAMDLREWHFGDDGDPAGLGEVEDLPVPANDLPDCSAHFDTIEALDNVIDSLAENCKLVYTLQTLSKVLDDSIAKYQSLMASDYDNKFQTYAHSIADTAGKTVGEWTRKHGQDYFTCVVAEASLCCDHCSEFSGANPCAYCNHGDCYHTVIARDEEFANASLVPRDHPKSSNVLTVSYQKQAEPCPPDFSQRGAGQHDQSVWWTLKSDKADQFYADLLTATGIAKDKITLQTVGNYTNCEGKSDPKDDCWNSGHDFNFPVPSGYEAKDVSNPKDVVAKALNSSSNIQGQLASALLQVKLTAFPGDISQLIDAVSTPVLMISDAVDNMDQVEQTAEKIDEEKKKTMIIAFLTAILFFIPIAGEVIGAVSGVAEVVAVLTAISVVGDVAMGVYSIVDDPSNPLLGIISIVLAPLALANISKLTKASDLRRRMSEADVAKLGGKIGGRMKTLQKITGTCRKMA